MNRPTFGDGWISLEHVLRFPDSARVREWRSLDRVWIYSTEHHAYWGPRRSGYYTDGLLAGIYTFADAFASTSHCGPEKGITYRSAAYFERSDFFAHFANNPPPIAWTSQKQLDWMETDPKGCFLQAFPTPDHINDVPLYLRGSAS